VASMLARKGFVRPERTAVRAADGSASAAFSAAGRGALRAALLPADIASIDYIYDGKKIKSAPITFSILNGKLKIGSLLSTRFIEIEGGEINVYVVGGLSAVAAYSCGTYSCLENMLRGTLLETLFGIKKSPEQPASTNPRGMDNEPPKNSGDAKSE
jgi:hypothetical protein